MFIPDSCIWELPDTFTELIPVCKECDAACLWRPLFEIQASLALMLLSHRLQPVMEGCSVQDGKLCPLSPALACSLLCHPGLHLTTTSRTVQLRLWPTQPPPPSLLMSTCRLCVPVTPCWPTHTRHCSLTLGWVGDNCVWTKVCLKFYQARLAFLCPVSQVDLCASLHTNSTLADPNLPNQNVCRNFSKLLLQQNLLIRG